VTEHVDIDKLLFEANSNPKLLFT